MQMKQSFLLLAQKSSEINLIVFPDTYAKPDFHTDRLSTEFRLGSPLIIITNLDIIFHKHVVAAFITFMNFIVFASMCFAVAKTIATALVSSRLE